MSIEIRGLTITIGDKPIVRDACMDIADGERIGLVGSSGSGKSMIAKALMGLLPDTARVSGSIMAGGRQLIGLDDIAMADLRGRYMGMVFQNPAAALNPVMTEIPTSAFRRAAAARRHRHRVDHLAAIHHRR